MTGCASGFHAWVHDHDDRWHCAFCDARLVRQMQPCCEHCYDCCIPEDHLAPCGACGLAAWKIRGGELMGEYPPGSPWHERGLELTLLGEL